MKCAVKINTVQMVLPCRGLPVSLGEEPPSNLIAAVNTLNPSLDIPSISFPPPAHQTVPIVRMSSEKLSLAAGSSLREITHTKR